MNQVEKMLSELQSGEFVSGSFLAEKYKVSRSAISQWIEVLGSYGLEVSKVRGKGYRLNPCPMLLEQERLKSLIADTSNAQFNVIDTRLETSSTNTDALNGIYSISNWNLYAAEYQQVGRGRRGKVWQSPLGANLLFSLGCKKEWSLDTIYMSSVITGLSLVSSLQQFLPNQKIQLKWPNDIYADGKKVAGILCELQGTPTSEALLVIGVGLNVLSYPKDTEVAATSLYELTRKAPDRTELLASLATSIVNNINKLDENNDTSLLKSWAHIDYLYEKQIKLKQGAQETYGVACGVDSKGQLIVKLEDGTKKSFNSGEVSVRLD